MPLIDDNMAYYPIDVEQAEEVDRQVRLGQLIARHIDLLPPQLSLTEGQVILDLGCGAGGWVLDMGRAHPDCQIVGIDVSPHIITYATLAARIQRLTNVQFIAADACQSLPFTEASFDVIHGRFLPSFILSNYWPILLAECRRLLRPGGVICSTESENLGIVTSPALTRYNTLIVDYLRRGKRCFTEEGPNFGITAVQAHLLSKSGFDRISQRVHELNYSIGTLAHPAAVDNYAAMMKLLVPALLREKIAPQEELTRLYTRALAEMHVDDFCGIALFQMVWGYKPL